MMKKAKKTGWEKSRFDEVLDKSQTKKGIREGSKADKKIDDKAKKRLGYK